MNFSLGQTDCEHNIFSRITAIRFLFGTRRHLTCGRIPAVTAACLFTNKVKQKSEVSFRSAKVNP